MSAGGSSSAKPEHLGQEADGGHRHHLIITYSHPWWRLFRRPWWRRCWRCDLRERVESRWVS